MILTDKGNRKAKPKEPSIAYGNSTFEEIEARVKRRFGSPTKGFEYVRDLGCECSIKLPFDVEEGTQQAIWFYENSMNHHEECMFVFLNSI